MKSFENILFAPWLYMRLWYIFQVWLVQHSVLPNMKSIRIRLEAILMLHFQMSMC